MVEFDSTSHHVEHLQNWHIRGSIRQLENSKKKIMTIMIKRAHSWRSLKLEAQLVKRCTGIAEVMSLNPVQAWFFFSGVISTTAQVVFITAKIAFIFTSLSAVQIYDIYVFTVVNKLILFLSPHLPRASKISIHKPQWARKTQRSPENKTSR